MNYEYESTWKDLKEVPAALFLLLASTIFRGQGSVCYRQSLDSSWGSHGLAATELFLHVKCDSFTKRIDFQRGIAVSSHWSSANTHVVLVVWPPVLFHAQHWTPFPPELCAWIDWGRFAAEFHPTTIR